GSCTSPGRGRDSSPAPCSCSRWCSRPRRATACRRRGATSMRDYDLLVVGGGPAGATLGGALRAQGWRVLLLDKAEFPRDKTCAGWVTPAVLDALRIAPGEYARERVLQPIHGFRIGLM